MAGSAIINCVVYFLDTLLGRYQQTVGKMSGGGIPIQEWSIISYHFKLQKQEYECSVSNGQDGLQELT